LDAVKVGFVNGIVAKMITLQHSVDINQAAVDATKSQQRDAAERAEGSLLCQG
jgi:hypothetical protein